MVAVLFRWRDCERARASGEFRGGSPPPLFSPAQCVVFLLRREGLGITLVGSRLWASGFERMAL
jgi:hypothetical protein